MTGSAAGDPVAEVRRHEEEQFRVPLLVRLRGIFGDFQQIAPQTIRRKTAEGRELLAG
jgi:hypothetical protein